jgi:hypothetical protein
MQVEEEAKSAREQKKKSKTENKKRNVHHGLQITDQLFKSNLTFCAICVFTLHADEWCVHNRVLNANFEEKFK